MRHVSSASSTTTLARLVAAARIEVFPTASAEDQLLAHVPLTRTITVTSSPSKGLPVTLGLAERLAQQGYHVVPHLAARMVSGRSELAEIVDRLAASGITDLFVPAGDAEPVGDYHDALGLLEDLAGLRHPFSHIGIPGYPESHPKIPDDVTVQAMWDKRHHVTHVVSNLTFSPAAVETWVQRLRSRGMQLPVLLGVPGPVHPAKLLAVANKIGVKDSTRFLMKNKQLFGRLSMPGGFTGERFLARCAAAVKSDALVEGLHVFTFNQIAETETWLSEFSQRLRK